MEGFTYQDYSMTVTRVISNRILIVPLKKREINSLTKPQHPFGLLDNIYFLLVTALSHLPDTLLSPVSATLDITVS